MNGAWIAEILWAPDSQSLFVTMNEGTFATGAQMFEMPIVRVTLADGKAERVGTGATVEYSMSLSRDGRTLAYREVQARTMGDVVVMDVASRKTQTAHDRQPAAERSRARRAEADFLEVVRRHGNLGPAADAAGLRPAFAGGFHLRQATADKSAGQLSRACRCWCIATAARSAA